ncbi:MAG: hypothetical protein WBL50_17520 [Candidatus Acidiferrum sp.]
MGQGLWHIRGRTSVWAIVAYAIFEVVSIHPPASAQTVPAKRNVASAAGLPEIVFVQTQRLVWGPLARRFPQGSEIVRFRPSATQHPTRLTEDFFAAADPQVSFDATRILFSAQKAQGDRWQIWEMNLDGSGKRQITHCRQDCLRAAYLPANEIVLTVEEATNERSVSYLAVAKTDGSDFQRITFGSAPFQFETVLRDGRVVASAPWPLVGNSASIGTRVFYTLRPDGTALESFRCQHQEKSTQADAEELTDGSLLFVRKGLTDKAVAGSLVKIPQGAFDGAPLGSRGVAYESARQLSDDYLVVAKQTAISATAASRFDLYLFHLKTGTLGERLQASAETSSIQPVPVLPRPTPKHYWNTLNPESTTGNFISLNSYLSADDPGGHIASPIAQVRVFALGAADGQEHNLGEAPVEADGSFFVKVPANQPVRFALLDAKGRIIREEHSWIWARPGEQRGCTGCHGDKSVAPENHWPQTLRRFDTPTLLGEIDHASATAQAK